ncbi:MAG: hypothetical protein LBQ90_11120 [Synergistaceae bacterium]|jgi:hypothetical protein|nr:hypothetical protein [Synergistaceae bacterium]
MTSVLLAAAAPETLPRALPVAARAGFSVVFVAVFFFVSELCASAVFVFEAFVPEAFAFATFALEAFVPEAFAFEAFASEAFVFEVFTFEVFTFEVFAFVAAFEDDFVGGVVFFLFSSAGSASGRGEFLRGAIVSRARGWTKSGSSLPNREF